MSVKTAKNLALSMIAPALVAIYTVSFLFLNNIEEVVLGDAIIPLLVSLAAVVILTLVFSFTAKGFYHGGILGGVFYVLMLNYKNIEDAIRTLSYRIRYWHVLPILLLLFGIAAFLFCRFISEDMAKQFSGVFALVFAGLVVINVVTNINGVIRMMSNTQDEAPTQVENNDAIEDSGVILGQPNVYYILLDEYSNFDILEKYYGDNNQEFYDFLTNSGFTVSEHSQNEIMNHYTLYITTNYLNLDYVSISTEPNAQATAIPFRIDPPLFQQFGEHGYAINWISSQQIRWKGSYGDRVESTAAGTTIDGKTFSQLFFSTTPLYPFISVADDESRREAMRYLFNYIVDHISESNQSRFLYVHTIGAHEPFVYGANGERVPASERDNLADPQYYLGQYKYTTKQVMDAIAQILEKDPDSVIIVMSDHSMRKTQNNSGEVIVSKEDLTTIFNAVYFRGEPMDEINNQSGVNTLRLVLDRLFDTNLGIVEVPAA